MDYKEHGAAVSKSQLQNASALARQPLDNA